MAFGGLSLTQAGRNLLAKAQNSKTMTLIKLAVGDGTYHGSFNEKKELSNFLFSVPVSVEQHDDIVTLEADISNSNLKDGYYLRELGVIAMDEEREVLYAYDNAGSDAEYINAAGEVNIEKRIKIVLNIAESIQVKIENPGHLYALEDDVTEHTDNSIIHVSSEEKARWNDTYTKAQEDAKRNIIVEDLTNHINDKAAHISASERTTWNQAKTKTDELSETVSKIHLENYIAKSDLLNLMYPIGSLYMSVNATNPSTLFGGTWERYAKGRTIVGVDENDGDFSTVKKTGGNKYLQSHNHGMTHTHSYSATTSNSGSHQHKVMAGDGGRGNINTIHETTPIPSGMTYYYLKMGLTSTINYPTLTDFSASHVHTLSGTTSNSSLSTTSSAGNGNSQNLQPYITSYIWIRTA